MGLCVTMGEPPPDGEGHCHGDELMSVFPSMKFSGTGGIRTALGGSRTVGKDNGSCVPDSLCSISLPGTASVGGQARQSLGLGG